MFKQLKLFEVKLFSVMSGEQENAFESLISVDWYWNGHFTTSNIKTIGDIFDFLKVTKYRGGCKSCLIWRQDYVSKEMKLRCNQKIIVNGDNYIGMYLTLCYFFCISVLKIKNNIHGSTTNPQNASFGLISSFFHWIFFILFQCIGHLYQSQRIGIIIKSATKYKSKEVIR